MPSDGNYIIQYGYGMRGQRTWGKPELFALSVEEVSVPRNIDITFSIISGGLLGKIRSDVQNSPVNSLRFTLNGKDCADFTLSLNRVPDFEILPNSLVKFSVGDSAFNWYCGTVDYPEGIGTNREKLEFKGYGLRKFLTNLRANVTYTAGTDISTIVADLVQTWMAPYCPIKYNASKIDGPSGVVLAFNIQVGKYNLIEVLSTLVLMAQTSGYYYVWGVDGEGEFYFSQINKSAIAKTFFIGYNCHDFHPKLNFNDIKNVITVTRKNATGGGGGWVVGGVYNNTSSVKKYGRQELVYQVPGYWSNSDCNLTGNALIANLAEPEHSATVGGINAWDQLNYLHDGVYRFVMPKSDDALYETILNDLDDHTQFTIGGTGDLAKSNESTFFVWANGAVKFTFQNALNQTAVMNVNGIGFIKFIKFYLRADKPNIRIRVGVGETVWNENTAIFNIRIPQAFFPMKWDISMLNLRSVKKFGIQILENYTSPTNLIVDKLAMDTTGHQTYKIKLLRTMYEYTPDRSEIKAEFGGLPPSLVQYIAGLQSSAESMKFTEETV